MAIITNPVDITQLRNVSSNAVKTVAKNAPTNSLDAYDGNNFGSVFNAALDNLTVTNGYLSDMEDEEIKWALGESDNTHDLTIAIQKATTALQYTVAVRDKVLEAYKELMQMQI